MADWCGFKIVGDNIDKNVKPRYMRINKGTQSLHYFNSYAIKDRVDCSSLEPEDKQPPANCDPLAVLPMEENYYQLFENCTMLLTRILVTHIPVFGSFRDTVTWHLQHEQSQAMQEKSHVVSLTMHIRSYV